MNEQTTHACPACRHPAARSADYCGRCGARLATVAAGAQAPAINRASAHRCDRCGAARQGTDRYCPSCGVDCWALAAGSAPTWSAGAIPTPAMASARQPLGSVLAGRRLRIGVGIAGAALLAVNAVAGLLGPSPGRVDIREPTGGTGGSGDVLGRSERGEEASVAPTTAAIGDDRTPATAATAAPARLRPGSGATVDPPPGASGPPDAAPPEPTDAPAPTGPPAETPGPLPTKVVLEGSGSEVTEPFAYPGGDVRVLSVASASSGACVYIGTFSSTASGAVPEDASLRTTVLFLDRGSADGWVDLDIPAGSYFMEIESDCAWTVTVAPR